MTVTELIARLSEQDPNAEVRFAYDYGDYWHTTAAGRVVAVTVKTVVSGVSGSPDAILDEDREAPEGALRAVVLW